MAGDKHLVDTRILIKEINRIVNAPYAILFSTLSTILARIDDSQLHYWTIVKECQIGALVGRLIGYLDEDVDALSVLLRLVGDAKIRDEVIKQKPGLLDRFFQDADGDETMFRACLSICRSPFPEAFMASAEYFRFVSSILANNRGEPESFWLEKVHSVLSSMPPYALSAIDPKTIQKCTALWNSCSKISNNSTFIKFLSVASKIYQIHSPDTTSLSCDTLASPKPDAALEWAVKCSSLFTNPKAQKSIKSVLLRTLLFLSEQLTAQAEHLEEDLELVRRILIAMSEDALQTASHDAEIAQVLSKIAHKSASDSVSLESRLCISGILLAVDPLCRSWDSTVLFSALEQYVCECLQFTGNSASYRLKLFRGLKFQHDYEGLLQALAKTCVKHKPFVQNLMQPLMAWCRPGMYVTIENICCLKFASMLAKCLLCPVTDQRTECEDWVAFDHIDIPEWWNWNFRSPDTAQNCCASDICFRTKEGMQGWLASNISNAIIISACISERKVSYNKYQMLMDVILSPVSSRTSKSCRWPENRKWLSINNDSFRTPTDYNHVYPQEQLNQSLSQISDQTYCTIQKYIDSVCRDLQQRCHNVEIPLKMEREKVSSLERRLSEVQQEIRIMETENEARRLSWLHNIEVAENEISALQIRQADMEQRMDKVSQQLEEEMDKGFVNEKAMDDFKQQCDVLQKDLQQEKLNSDMYKDDVNRLTVEKGNLQQQLQDAQEKEQKMFCVLRGGHSLS